MKDGKVFAKDTVTIYGTGASNHMVEGQAYNKIHKDLADDLIAKGFATKEKPEGKAAGKKKGETKE